MRSKDRALHYSALRGKNEGPENGGPYLWRSQKVENGGPENKVLENGGPENAGPLLIVFMIFCSKLMRLLRFFYTHLLN